MYHLTWYTCFPRSEQEFREFKSRVYHVTLSTWYIYLPRSARVYIPPVPLVPGKRAWIHAQGDKRADWRAGAGAAWITVERAPYVNGQKDVVLLVHGRKPLADQAKRCTTSALPRGTPEAGKSLAVQVFVQVRHGSRAVPRLVVQPSARCSPGDQVEADFRAEPPCGPRAAQPSLSGTGSRMEHSPASRGSQKAPDASSWC